MKKITKEFWSTTTGKKICNIMHDNAWEALDCLNAEINALTAACSDTTDQETKAVLEKAIDKLVAARAACRKAMEILSDEIF